MNKKLVGILLLTLICSACSSVKNDSMQTTNQERSTKALIHSPSYLSKDQFGEKWAFTVDHVIVECRQDAVYVYDDNGTVYPLNGIAISRFKNDPNAKDVSNIQQFDDAQNKILEQINEGRPFTKARKDLSFAMSAGLKLCK